MDRKILAGALLTIGIVAALGASTPNYTSNTQRVEHVGIATNTTAGHCVRLDMGTGIDAGWYLSGEPDAAAPGSAPGPDAAIWQVGGDAAVWIPADAAAMGPRPGPRTDISYECVARNNSACLRQGTGTAAFSCAYSKFLPADMPMPPQFFLPEPDGGMPIIRGISTVGASNLECCEIVPAVVPGR